MREEEGRGLTRPSSKPAHPPISAPAGDLIQLRDVSKRYSTGVVALEDVSLDVSSGEFLSILGPSGCGKSTILRLIAGLADVTGGELRVLGQSAEAARRSTGDLALVFQEATLMPWRTVVRNVELPLEMRGVRRGERRAEAEKALELVGLADAGRLYPRQLSGGMKMRVSIARALVSRPRVLLMDEPFGALDELTRQRLQQDLLRIWAEGEEGLTVVFVTHNVFEAAFLSQRIAVMTDRPGRVRRVFEVDAPHPRDDAFRASREFGKLVADVTGALHA
jgi:NitT/TauT family transport system ATP-binding protein